MSCTLCDLDPVSRPGGIASVPMLATCGESFDSRCIESPKFTKDGCNRPGGPVRQNVPFIQRPTYRKEKDARQEKNAKSRVQRELRV